MHYSMFVYGDDVEAQLEPFCGDRKENLKLIPSEIDLSIKGFKSVAEYFNHLKTEFYVFTPFIVLNQKQFDELNQPDTIETLIYYGIESFLVIDDKGQLLKIAEIRCVGMWDWYSIGGRWSGKLLIKPDVGVPIHAIRGGRDENETRERLKRTIPFLRNNENFKPLKLNTDQYDALPKKAIDWERMQSVPEIQTLIQLFEIHLKSNQKEECLLFSDYIVEEEVTGFASYISQWDKIRELYLNQPAVKTLLAHIKEKNSDKVVRDTFAIDAVLMASKVGTFDEGVQFLRDYYTLPASSLREGVWVDKKEIWFLGKTGYLDVIQSVKEMKAHWDQALEDETVTVVDCHC